MIIQKFLLFLFCFQIFSQQEKFIPTEKLDSSFYLERNREVHNQEQVEVSSIDIVDEYRTKKRAGVKVEVTIKFQSNTCPYSGLSFESLEDRTILRSYAKDKRDVEDYFDGQLACAMWFGISKGVIPLSFEISHRRKRKFRKLLKKEHSFTHLIRGSGLKDQFVQVLYRPRKGWSIKPAL